MKKLLTIVAAALLTLSLHAASWTFTNIQQSNFYPTGQEAVDGSYWTINGSSSYQYKNLSTADELYVIAGQKFAPTEGLKFLTRGNNFRVFFNGSGIRLVYQGSGVNPSIVIPACKAGSDLKIVAKQDGSGTMALTNTKDASFTLDGNNTTYTTSLLADGDVVINMSAGIGYIRSIEVVEHSVYTAQAMKSVVTLFEDEVTGVETNCTDRRGVKDYTIDGTSYKSVQAWTLKTSKNLTFRVKDAKKVTFVGRAANGRGFAISLNGAAAENIMNEESGEVYLQKELTMVDGVNVISITSANSDVYPLAFIVEKDAEEIVTMSGTSMTFSNGAEIIYSGNIAISTETNEATKGFAKSSDIQLYDGELNAIRALRVVGTSTITIAAPSNYIIEKIGVRAAGATAARTIKINDANGHNFAQVDNTTESEYFEWTLATPSNQLTLSTNGTMYFIITLFGYTTEYYPVTVSNNWATFYADKAVIVPEGLIAYQTAAEQTGTDCIYLVEFGDDVIPANTPVILGSTTDGLYNMFITTAGNPVADNWLAGTVKRIANPGNNVYCLNTDGYFHPYEGMYIPSNKAYLTNASGAAIRIVTTPSFVTPVVENAEAVAAKKVVVNGQICILRNGAKYNVAGKKIQ